MTLVRSLTLLVTQIVCVYLPIVVAASSSNNDARFNRLRDDEIRQLNKYRVLDAAGAPAAGRVLTDNDDGYHALRNVYNARNGNRRETPEVNAYDYIKKHRLSEGYHPIKSELLHDMVAMKSYAVEEMKDPRFKSPPNVSYEDTLAELKKQAQKWRKVGSELHCELLNGTKLPNEHIDQLKAHDRNFAARKIIFNVTKERAKAARNDQPQASLTGPNPISAEEQRRQSRGKHLVGEESNAHRQHPYRGGQKSKSRHH